MKQVRYFLEAVLLAVLMAVFKILPLDMASAAGGWAGRAIGPRLAASRKAFHNLQEALPELDERRRKEIVAGMWDNLGRVMAEYPHLEQIGRERVTITCGDTTEGILRSDRSFMIIASHLANWELGSALIMAHFNRPFDFTYRAPNNPWADSLLMKARSLGGRVRGYPKSRGGGQELIKAMREGRNVGILIDQKYNEGVAAPFFGRPAMTNTVFISLSRKFDYPLIPVQIERIKGAHFAVTLHEPLVLADKSVEDGIAQAHAHLESWIRKRPEQWLWLHRRWESGKLGQNK